MIAGIAYNSVKNDTLGIISELGMGFDDTVLYRDISCSFLTVVVKTNRTGKPACCGIFKGQTAVAATAVGTIEDHIPGTVQGYLTPGIG
jgi:hypothetical protein